MPIYRRLFSTVAALVPLAFSISFAPGAMASSADSPTTSASTGSNAVVAKGKGFEVKRNELDDLYVSYCARAAAQGQPVPDEARTSLRSNLLQHIILSKILTAKATDDDRAKTKQKIEIGIAQARTNAGSEEAFEMRIKASGMSLEQIRSNEFNDALPTTVLIRETTKGVEVSDDAAKKYYDENPDKFERPEEVKAAHILISTQDPITKQPLPADKKKEKEALAKQVREKAMAGEDFGKLAKQYSDDPGSKDNGGEYTFPRGQMVPAFEAAAFSLKTNQISDLVETQYGYHIIKLEEKIPPSKVDFAKVEPQIKEALQRDQVETNAPAYLEKLRADADVVILDPELGGKAGGTN